MYDILKCDFGSLFAFNKPADPAKIVKLPSEYEVTTQESLSLHCQAEGNPQPTYTWTPCEPQQSTCHESTLFIPVVPNDAVYSCNVTNVLGSDTTKTSIGKLVFANTTFSTFKWHITILFSDYVNIFRFH